MSEPPLRAVPPSPAQLAADADAPYVVFFPRGVAEDRLRAALMRLAENDDGPAIFLDDGPSLRLHAARPVLQRLVQYLGGVGYPGRDALRRYLRPVLAWQLRTRRFALDRPHIMGILNLTDDSFSGDGVGADLSAALARAEQLRADGASLIDVGAESARADRPVRDEHEEAKVVREAVTALVREGHIVSCDTYKRPVAEAALEAGADVVNDISGLTAGDGAARAAAEAAAGYVLNYSYSVPKQRPDRTPYHGDIVVETLAWFYERVAELQALGLGDGQIAVDPGIAFGKSHDEDLQVLRRLGELTSTGLPLLIAHSRKNFIGSVTGQPPDDRDLETHLVSAAAYMPVARIFRVHDVAGAHRALQMAAALATASPGDFAPDGESWPWRAGASGAHMARGDADKAPPPGQRW